MSRIFWVGDDWTDTLTIGTTLPYIGTARIANPDDESEVYATVTWRGKDVIFNILPIADTNDQTEVCLQVRDDRTRLLKEGCMVILVDLNMTLLVTVQCGGTK